MAGKFAVALVISAAILGVNAQFPIPARYDGFPLSGPKSARPVVLEAFLDLLCPSCRAGWPILKEITERYPEDKLQLIVHPFPVPFHHNANFAARGMHIAASINSSLAYPWMELVYKYQNDFSDGATSQTTPAQVVDRFSEIATELGIEKSRFRAGFEDYRTDSGVRVSFKYGCHRGVVATPTYLVNGVAVLGADERWTVKDWAVLLDPMLEDTTDAK